nr:hypothetical protein [Tanacetum cinerariifolium]
MDEHHHHQQGNTLRQPFPQRRCIKSQLTSSVISATVALLGLLPNSASSLLKALLKLYRLISLMYCLTKTRTREEKQKQIRLSAMLLHSSLGLSPRRVVIPLDSGITLNGIDRSSLPSSTSSRVKPAKK